MVYHFSAQCKYKQISKSFSSQTKLLAKKNWLDDFDPHGHKIEENTSKEELKLL